MSIKDFEWDDKKQKTNLKKHGIDFEDVIHVFDKPVIVKEDNRKDYGEKRFIALGILNKTIVNIVYTRRGEKKRFISARRANPKERTIYIQYYSNY